MIVFMITETIQKEEISTERISLIGDSSIKDSEFRYKLHLKLLKYFLLISIITALSYSVEINSELLRPFFTVSTGILMILSRRDVILSFPILTYIGDISYSLYLIHWPFYAYWKLELSGGQTWNFSLLAAFSLSVLLAVISYEYFEKRYLQWTGKLVSTFCVVLIASNCLILHRDQIERYLIPQPPRNFDRLDGIVDGAVSFDQAEKLNEEWSVNDYRDTYVPTCTYENGKGPFGRCEHNATVRFM
uniref:Acyl_transf_3 domain-containing protein n=1 Tax=Caenorhabditis tropicalis TaxID=1561998 RepID=A0A1I7V022_9PELO